MFVFLLVTIGVEFFLTAKVVRQPEGMKAPILAAFFAGVVTMLGIWAAGICVLSAIAELTRREPAVGSELSGRLFKTTVRDLVRFHNWRHFD